MILIGEVHSGLLQHATALVPSQCEQLLSLSEGEPVLRSERPASYVVSPEQLTGVDCRLPSRAGRAVRGAGTVTSRAIVTGGRILQGSSHATVDRGRRRQLWSYYLAQPGRIEAIGALDGEDVRAGFLAGHTGDEVLSIGSISGRAMDRIQASDHLDRRPPLRAPRTVLRWSAVAADDPSAGPRATFVVESDTVRTLAVVVGAESFPDVAGLCEDIARHDWLLTTVSAIVGLTLSGRAAAADRVARLAPVIEQLLHLWMPGARVSDALLPLWDGLEKRPGFSRQWDASVDWVRDQMSVGTMALLQDALRTIAER